MNLKFKPVTAEDIAKIIPFFGLRPDKTCESVFLDSFLWRDYYHIQYTIYEEKGLLWKMEQEGKTYTSIPSCRQEDLPELLGIMEDYFNQTLGMIIPVHTHINHNSAVLNIRIIDHLPLSNSSDQNICTFCNFF